MFQHLLRSNHPRQSGYGRLVKDNIVTSAGIPATAGMTSKAVGTFAAASLLLLTALPVPAQTERPRPSATEYVATVETLIEACSRAKPADAMRYSEVRDIVNSALPKKNYAEIQATTLYKQIRERFIAEVSGVPQARLLQECGALDRLIEAKPEDLGLRDE